MDSLQDGGETTRVTCPHCGRSGSTSKALAEGAKVRCPGCGQGFRYASAGPTTGRAEPSATRKADLPRIIEGEASRWIAGPAEAPPPAVVPQHAPIQQVHVYNAPAPPPAPVLEPIPVVRETPAAPAPATRECPYCAEAILANARKCKHCGEIVDVALRAAEEAKALAIAAATRAHAAPNVNTNTVIVSASAGMPVARWNPLTAVILSILCPGLGQLYKGQFLNGMVWFSMVVFGYFVFIVPGLLLHCCCVLGAGMGDPTR